MKSISIFFFVAMLFSGCIRYYKYTNRGRKVVHASYSCWDTIYVRDYILCNGIRDIDEYLFYPRGGEVVSVNEDSVLMYFKKAFKELNIPMRFDAFGDNYCDSVFHKNVLVRDRKVDHNRIREISKRSNNQLVIVPLVYVDNVYDYQMYLLSSGVAIGGDLVKNSFLNVAIYILREEDIIYFNSGMHRTISRHEDLKEEPKRQTQENWDKLVEMIMRDYINRME